MTEHPIRVLVVDDSPEDRLIYSRLLAHDDAGSWQLFEAETGEDGLARQRAVAPEAVLLDYRLPDLDGLEFLEQLQQQPGGTSVAVVMVTGQGNEAIAVEALRRGAHDYLVKDALTRASLLRALDNAMEKVRLRHELEAERWKLRAAADLLARQSAEIDRLQRTVADGMRPALDAVRDLVQRGAGSGALDAEMRRCLEQARTACGGLEMRLRDLLASSPSQVVYR